MEYSENTMESLVLDIWSAGNYLVVTTNKYSCLMQRSRVVLWTKIQFAMFEIKDTQWNLLKCIFFFQYFV